MSKKCPKIAQKVPGLHRCFTYFDVCPRTLRVIEGNEESLDAEVLLFVYAALILEPEFPAQPLHVAAMPVDMHELEYVLLRRRECCHCPIYYLNAQLGRF